MQCISYRLHEPKIDKFLFSFLQPILTLQRRVIRRWNENFISFQNLYNFKSCGNYLSLQIKSDIRQILENEPYPGSGLDIDGIPQYGSFLGQWLSICPQYNLTTYPQKCIEDRGEIVNHCFWSKMQIGL